MSMTTTEQWPEDDEDAQDRAEELEFKALVDAYVQRFGKEPDWWVLGPSDDRAHDIREAIRTGQPIVLNIPPGCEA